MAMTIKEIRHIMTLEKTSFLNEMKGIDKITAGIDNNFKQVNKEIKKFEADIKELAKELNKLDDIKFTDAKNQIEGLEKTLVGLRSELKKVATEAKEANKAFSGASFDLSGVNRLKNLMSSIKEVKLIDMNQLKQAQVAVDKIKTDLRGVNNIEVRGAANNVSNGINSISMNSGLRHWIDDGNNSTPGGFNGDIERVLRQILEKMSNLGSLQGGTLSEDIRKMSDDISKTIVKESEKIVNAIDNVNISVNKLNTKSTMSRDIEIGASDNELENTANETMADLAKIIRRMRQATTQADENERIIRSQTPEEVERSTRLYQQLIRRQQIDALARRGVRLSNEQYRNEQHINDQLNQQNQNQQQQNNQVNQRLTLMQRLGRYANIINSVTNISNSNLGQRVGGASQNAGNIINAVRSGAGGAGAGALGAAGGAAGNAAGGTAALTGATVAAGAAIAGVLVVVVAYVAALKVLVGVMKKGVEQSQDFQDAVAKFAAATGASQKQISQFNKDLTESFKQQGYTEDVKEYGNVLLFVTRNLKLTGQAAKDMAKDLLAVSKTTGYDTNEIVRAQNNLMKNMNMDASQALDMIMSTYQKTGDYSNDLLDTLSEYSSQFKKTGLSAEYFYNLLVIGSQNGVMNLDKVGDAFKEMQLRMFEGNDETKKAVGDLGLSYNALIGDINKGGPNAENAMNRITTAIAKVGDNAKRQKLIATLFGGAGEDIGSGFFEALSKATTDVGSFKGAVEGASTALENTLGYQLSMLQNQITTIWDQIGKKILPIVQQVTTDINNNMDTITAAIDEYLVPSLLELAQTIAYAFGLDDVTDFSDALITIIKGISGIVRTVSFVTLVFRKTYEVIKILVKSLTVAIALITEGIIVVGSIAIAVVTGIQNAFDQLNNGLSYVMTGIVETFDHGFMLLVKGAGNVGIGIINAIVWAAKKAYNGLVDFLINPFIDAYNDTIAKIPGVPTLNRAGYANTDKQAIGYISLNDDLKKISGAWTGSNNPYLKKMQETQANYNKVYKGLYDFNAKSAEVIGDFVVDLSESTWQDMKDLVTKGPKDLDNYVNQYVKKDRVQSGTKPQTPPTGKGTSNPKGYEGKDKTKEDEEKAKKAAEDAKKAAEERLKNKQDYYKRLIAFEKQAQSDMIKIEDEAMQKKWGMMDQNKALYQEQIKYYNDYKKKYILTNDEMMAANDKQFEAAKNLRAQSLSDAKKAMDNELKIYTDGQNKKVKEFEGYIKEIDRKLAKAEQDWSNTDEANEISKLEKEYNKLAKASSASGIQKRKELEDELNTKRTEQQRNAERQSLESQKQNYQDQIDNLNKQTEEMTKKYNDMYTELESLVNNKESFLGKVRENMTTETNANIKKSLDQLVVDYQNAYAEIEKTTMSNVAIQNNRIVDAKRQWIEGNLTGDTNIMEEATWQAQDARKRGGTLDSSATVDKQNNWGTKGSPDYVYFKSLQQEWGVLQKQKNGKNDAEIIAKQNKLHAEANILRKKYGVKENADIPMYPKFHNGGIVSGLTDRFGEVAAKLLPGEGVLSTSAFSRLMDFIDNVVPKMGLNPNLTTPNGAITNNVNISIGEVNNSKDVDLNKFTQQLEHWSNQKSRANGTRKI